ncbi:MAG: hotdog domain-containing protein [Acidimicrobiia bacterium]
MEIVIGVAGSAHLIVGEEDTAIALGSGDVPVLGTPRIVALLEEAAVAALAGDLADGITSVGTHIAVDHVSASFVGAAVAAVAEVVAVEGRTVMFRLTAQDGSRTVATGNHTRLLVDRARFLGRASATTRRGTTTGAGSSGTASSG